MISDKKNEKTAFIDCDACVLDKICHPEVLAGNSLGFILEHMEQRHPIPQGASLYNSGQQVNSVYAVTSGTFKLTHQSDANEHIHGFRFPGELLGDEALATSSHPLNAVAIQKSSVCIIPLELIRNTSQAIPGFQQAFLTLITRQCHLAYQQIASYVALKNADQKLASFLINLHNRTIQEKAGNSSVRLTMPRTDIANYLGLRHETLSRTFSRFQHHQLVALKGKVLHILKPDDLNNIASGFLSLK